MHTYIDKHTYIDSHTYIDRHTYINRDTYIDRQRDIDRHTYIDRHTMSTELSKMYKIKAIVAKSVKLLKYPADDQNDVDNSKEILTSL